MNNITTCSKQSHLLRVQFYKDFFLVKIRNLPYVFMPLFSYIKCKSIFVLRVIFWKPCLFLLGLVLVQFQIRTQSETVLR